MDLLVAAVLCIPAFLMLQVVFAINAVRALTAYGIELIQERKP